MSLSKRENPIRRKGSCFAPFNFLYKNALDLVSGVNILNT